MDNIFKILIEDNCLTREEINKGYTIAMSDCECVIPGTHIVEKIDILNKFDDDFDACRMAEKDGIKFINDINGLEKGCYLDTPENRAICETTLAERVEFHIDNLIKNFDNKYWIKYRQYYCIED